MGGVNSVHKKQASGNPNVKNNPTTTVKGKTANGRVVSPTPNNPEVVKCDKTFNVDGKNRQIGNIIVHDDAEFEQMVRDKMTNGVTVIHNGTTYHFKTQAEVDAKRKELKDELKRLEIEKVALKKIIECDEVIEKCEKEQLVLVQELANEKKQEVALQNKEDDLQNKIDGLQVKEDEIQKKRDEVKRKKIENDKAKEEALRKVQELQAKIAAKNAAKLTPAIQQDPALVQV